ncbi:iron-sulfur cluster assembly scaffold protein [Candidatus Micrarchaeota archaeon RBG_16_36_9]|nr:MAG: iron-sulfur cluster assembly scaffold protein [Candidatus Micrarchaeota archaeon RBG_16_36_9]
MKTPSLYSKEIMKHFKHPKNIGIIKDADGIGEAGNVVCGDIMKIYIKVKNNKIADIKAECFGCIVAIANTSLLTTMVKGMNLKDALEVTKDDIVKKLGGVPPLKYHCSLLAIDALSEAIYNYYKKNNIPIPEKLKDKHERIQQSIESIEKRAK